jgi:TRAP-type mannitol/chloroaromatic compound transport system permease small subunit
LNVTYTCKEIFVQAFFVFSATQHPKSELIYGAFLWRKKALKRVFGVVIFFFTEIRKKIAKKFFRHGREPKLIANF